MNEERHYLEEWGNADLARLVTSWNGDEQTFYHEGDKYMEEDVRIAEEILASRGKTYEDYM